jgi:hypothetical protein
MRLTAMQLALDVRIPCELCQSILIQRIAPKFDPSLLTDARSGHYVPARSVIQAWAEPSKEASVSIVGGFRIKGQTSSSFQGLYVSSSFPQGQIVNQRLETNIPCQCGTRPKIRLCCSLLCFFCTETRCHLRKEI